MFNLIYVSSSAGLLSPARIVELLAQCHRNNAARNLTGMLLYKDGNFMQLLEGAESVVRETHATITLDPRHQKLLTLVQAPIAVRQFPTWSMGFHDLRVVDPQSLPGYSEFLTTPLTAREFSSDPSKSQKLLSMFKRTM